MKGSEYQKREKKKENIYHTMIRRLKEAQPHLYTSPQTLLPPTTINVSSYACGNKRREGKFRINCPIT